jgi:alanine-glyoxylate transaminase/(R)-3-amino-2-methylpropionate-pyruvate transaminase
VKSVDAHRDQKEFLFPCIANYYESPLVLVKAKGCTAVDVEGREYLDFFGGILTISLEHGHDEVNEAVQSQLKTLGHISTLYQNLPQLEVAKKLAELSPGALKKSFFTNSGTEANETAIVLAKVFTKRSEIIVLRHSYSGRSHLSLNTTGHAPWRVLESSIPGIKHAHAPYCYRCPFGLTYPSCELRCATDLEELIQTETSGQIAAFMAEPILGVGGFIVPPDDYFEVAVGIARKYGGVFVCDEVQTGFGRTGDKWFGIEHSGVEPDIMTMAKGIANGFPVGATIAKAEIADTFTKPSICTFGGNPVSMAAASATISVMVRENVPKLAKEKGQIIHDTLKAIEERFAIVGEVRGRGLMWGIELVTDRKTKKPAPDAAMRVLETAKSLGLLLGKGGLYGNVIRMAPPMLIEKREIEEGCALLTRAFEQVFA